VIEHGGSWSTELEPVFDEDAGALRGPRSWSSRRAAATTGPRRRLLRAGHV